MAKLKFKNGSSWVELSMGLGGTLNQMYPVGSFYYGPVGAYHSFDSLVSASQVNHTYDNSTDTSPATLFGGTWTEITPSPISLAGNYSYNREVSYKGVLQSPSIYASSTDGSAALQVNAYLVGIGLNQTGSTNRYGPGTNIFYARDIPLWKGQEFSTQYNYRVYFCSRIWQRVA